MDNGGMKVMAYSYKDVDDEDNHTYYENLNEFTMEYTR